MRFVVIIMMIFLSACVTPGGERITDFSNRSVIYGWLDIKDVDANRLHNVTLYQYYPKTNLPYFNVKVVEFEEGYLYYAFSFEQGSYGLDSVAGQQCFGLCGNTIYTYTFGRQGDEVGKVRINEPGVYNIGTFKLTEIDTGLFEQSKFDILPASNVPSEYSMLEAMLPDAKDKPQIDALLRAAMQKHEI